MSRRILIVDDEPNIVAAIEFLLQRSGYEVHIAQDGEEAIELVEACVPDLVLLDVMMPKKSGHEVCARIPPMDGASGQEKSRRGNPGGQSG